MNTLHRNMEEIWLLSICLEANGRFHFRGYLKGRWITEVLVEIRDIENYKFEGWLIGASYLLKLEVLNVDQKGILYGLLLKQKHLKDGEIANSWEDF
jgi:hypothetical protein